MKIGDLAKIIGEKRVTAGSSALLVGISGIDASGKGHVTEKLARKLKRNAATGETFHAISSLFGYYRFEGIAVGRRFGVMHLWVC